MQLPASVSPDSSAWRRSNAWAPPRRSPGKPPVPPGRRRIPRTAVRRDPEGEGWSRAPSARRSPDSAPRPPGRGGSPRVPLSERPESGSSHPLSGPVTLSVAPNRSWSMAVSGSLICLPWSAPLEKGGAGCGRFPARTRCARISYVVLLCDSIMQYMLLQHIMLYYIMLYYIMLYYIMLYQDIISCMILCFMMSPGGLRRHGVRAAAAWAGPGAVRSLSPPRPRTTRTLRRHLRREILLSKGPPPE